MSDRLSVYLAGPEVFLPDARDVGRRKKAACQRFGFVGLFPLDNAAAPDVDMTVSKAIYLANLALITGADFGIFNLTPFRGPSADVGTVFELGVFIGLNKPVFAYSNDADDLLARVKTMTRLTQSVADGVWLDDRGMGVENFGNADNLMIDEALAGQDRTVHRRAVKDEARFYELDGFEACLREAASAFKHPCIGSSN